MGPVFYDSRALVASASIDIISASDWIYRRLPWPAALMLTFNHTGAAGTVLATVILGSDTQIGPEMPVAAGGTAGVYLNEEGAFVTLLGAAGDEVKVVFRETAAATPTVNTIIKLFPQ